MKRLKPVLAICCTAIALGAANNVEAREFADIYTDCGLGAMIAPRTPAVAAVTNVTWDLGTTAISSNISSPDTCQGGKAKTAAFIHRSYDSIEADIARGEGVYLQTLLHLTETPTDNQAETIQKLRHNFAKLVSSPAYANQTRKEKSAALYSVIYSSVVTGRS